MGVEVLGALGGGIGPLAAKLLAREAEADALSYHDEWYNEDEQFEKAVREVLRSKRDVLSEDTRLQLMVSRLTADERSATDVAGLREGGAAPTELRVHGKEGGFSFKKWNVYFTIPTVRAPTLLNDT